VASRIRERSVLAVPGSLEDLKAQVERCTLLLTNDTGPRHVAVALGRPVITLMGPTDPRHTAHLLEKQRVLFEDVACRPCGRPTCPIDHRCLRRLSPERAVQAADELLA
jgi:heptosyltransferase-2